MALLPGSPALDAGDNAGVPTVDQRGFARITHNVVDIGADESSGFTISVVSGDKQSTTVNAAFAAPLVVSVSGMYGEPVAGGVVTFTAPQTGAEHRAVDQHGDDRRFGPCRVPPSRPAQRPAPIPLRPRPSASRRRPSST